MKTDYDATWSDQTDPAGVPGAGSAPETNTKEWKFHAAQLTYNATTGQWASKVWAEQNDLFVRLLNSAKVEPPLFTYACGGWVSKKIVCDLRSHLSTRVGLTKHVCPWLPLNAPVSGGRHQGYADALSAEHLSVKMEASEEDHVHVHVYFNSDKVYHRRGRDALNIFCFEGRQPYPN